MKVVAAYLIFLAAETCAHVTNRDFETTKTINVESNTPSGPVQSFDHSGYIYLDDVIFALKTQNWTTEELPCLNQTLSLIRSLQNFTLWAVWEWDSVMSQPLAILSGNRYQLGDFDQCMQTPWDHSYPEIRTQYCLAEVVLERNEHVKKKMGFEPVNPYRNALDYIEREKHHYRPLKYLTWGACVPAVCKARSVERLVGTVLARSHLGVAGLRPQITVNETCQQADQRLEFDGAFYAFFVIFFIAILAVLTGTYLKHKLEKEDATNSTRFEIYKALCIKENAKNLLKMDKDGVKVIYGIRFISICFIVMSHQSAMLNAGPLQNGVEVDGYTLSNIGWLGVHNDVFVDTFYVISGFLVAGAFTSFKKMPNIVMIILRRYLRLIVALSLSIFYVAAVFPFTGSGPIWQRISDAESGTCRKNWWLNLLMLNNYIRPDEACIVVSWYIPTEFHFFVVTLLVYCLYMKSPKLGVTCAGVLVVASVISAGAVNYINELPAIHLFTYDFTANPRKSKSFQLIYIPSHVRATTYAMGFFAGYFYVYYKKKGNTQITKKLATICAYGSVVLMILVMFSGGTYLWRGTYSQVEAALYTALNRPVWAAALIMLIYSCSFGKVPLITSFLSWYPWVPLSRLAYGIYLIHTIIIIHNVGVTRVPVHYDNFNVLILSLGVTLISAVAALIIWILFEAPINKLYMICVMPKKYRAAYTEKTNKNLEDTAEAPEDKTDKGKTNSGYLQENLPERVQYSSKM